MRPYPCLTTMPRDATVADRHTWDLETADGWDRYWRHQQFAHVPGAFLLPVATQYRNTWLELGERPANIGLLDFVERLDKLVIDPATSDDDLVALGQRLARQCREVLQEPKDHRLIAERLARTCERFDIEPPTGLRAFLESRTSAPTSIGPPRLSPHDRAPARALHGTDSVPVPVPVTVPVTATVPVPVTILRNGTETDSDAGLGIGVIGRLTDDAWWRRKLRKIHGRLFEAEAIRLHLVRSRAGRFVSDATFRRHQEQRRRNQKTLEGLVAENEAGEVVELTELVAGSLANPVNRRNELMVRISGFDQVAQTLGHRAVLLTVTCPSRMHSHLDQLGLPNPSYDGTTTPRTAQAYLATLFQRMRAKWNRNDIRPYGFRIAEPHHDGTPHWHLLLFIEPKNLRAMIAIAHAYALAETPNERGARKHRFRVEYIDPKKGTAAGYVAKYVSKNIDGHGLPDTPDEPNPGTLAQRVSAWGGNWGIRQFQQIGGPPVSFWREFRRASELTTTPGLIGELAFAADEGNWRDFVLALGGPQIKRRALPIKFATYEDQRLGRYGEPLGTRIAGISLGNVIYSTRFHTWSIRKKEPQQNCTPENLASDVCSRQNDKGSEGITPSPPWSSVNNCTANLATRNVHQAFLQHPDNPSVRRSATCG